MKTLTLKLVTAAVTLCGAGAFCAESRLRTVAAASPDGDVIFEKLAPPAADVLIEPTALHEVILLAQAQAAADALAEPPTPPIPPPVSPAPPAPPAPPSPPSPPSEFDKATAVWAGLEDRIDDLGGRFFSSRRPGKALVVKFSKGEKDELGQIEEDLAVMSRILEKTVENQVGRKSAEAMGIPVRALLSGSPPIQNMYLDGYGALFFLKTRFPLVAPDTKVEDEKPKESTNSTWDQTKRELYGPRESEGAWGKQFNVFFGGEHEYEPYDPKRVEALKDALLEALKQASNIRSLKADEFVVVTAVGPAGGSGHPRAAGAGGFGGSAGGDGVSGGRSGSGGGGGGGRSERAEVKVFSKDRTVVAGDPYAAKSDGRGETIMSLRVKKSDIDAYAKGRLNAEEFRRKASINIYKGTGGGGPSASVLPNTFRR